MSIEALPFNESGLTAENLRPSTEFRIDRQLDYTAIREEVRSAYSGPLEVQRKTSQIDIRADSLEKDALERRHGTILLKLLRNIETSELTGEEEASLREELGKISLKMLKVRVVLTEHIAHATELHDGINRSPTDKGSLVADLQPPDTSNPLFG